MSSEQEIAQEIYDAEEKEARRVFSGLNTEELRREQRWWSAYYRRVGPTHLATARCVAILDLLREKGHAD